MQDQYPGRDKDLDSSDHAQTSQAMRLVTHGLRSHEPT
jgi:hypothetical protein